MSQTTSSLKRPHPSTAKTGGSSSLRIATPGELIEVSQDFIRGHGTYVSHGGALPSASDAHHEDASHIPALSDQQGASDSQGDSHTILSSSHRTHEDLPAGMYACQAGVVCQLNKLKYIQPLKCRYSAKIGDVIVGRVVEIQQKRWLVECDSQQQAVLALTDAQLPDGELRRKFKEDEQAMSQYLREGDLVVAEVRDISRDGDMRVHMRSTAYGRLGQGIVTKFPLHLLRRQKLHQHQLSFGVALILGANGWAWIGRSASTPAVLAGFQEDVRPYSEAELLNVVRVNCALRLLVEHAIPLWELSVETAWRILAEHVPDDLEALQRDQALAKELADFTSDHLRKQGAL